MEEKRCIDYRTDQVTEVTGQVMKVKVLLLTSRSKDWMALAGVKSGERTAT